MTCLPCRQCVGLPARGQQVAYGLANGQQEAGRPLQRHRLRTFGGFPWGARPCLARERPESPKQTDGEEPLQPARPAWPSFLLISVSLGCHSASVPREKSNPVIGQPFWNRFEDGVIPCSKILPPLALMGSEVPPLASYLGVKWDKLTAEWRLAPRAGLVPGLVRNHKAGRTDFQG